MDIFSKLILTFAAIRASLDLIETWMAGTAVYGVPSWAFLFGIPTFAIAAIELWRRG